MPRLPPRPALLHAARGCQRRTRRLRLLRLRAESAGRREVRRAAHPDDGRAQGRQGSRPDRRGEDAGRAQGLRRAQHLTPAQVLLRISRSEISF